MIATQQPLDRPERVLQRDLKTLTRFIRMYCHDLHGAACRIPVAIKTHDIDRIAGGELRLCAECTKLLQHALVKRSTCVMDPKPTCKSCPKHCYHARYRQQIRRVMRYSGKKMIFRGRLDLLWHFLF